MLETPIPRSHPRPTESEILEWSPPGDSDMGSRQTRRSKVYTMLFPPRWALSPQQSRLGTAHFTFCPAFDPLWPQFARPVSLLSQTTSCQRRAQILTDICSLGHGQSSLGTEKGPRQCWLHWGLVSALTRMKEQVVVARQVWGLLKPLMTSRDFPGATGLIQTMSWGFRRRNSSLLNYAAVSTKFLPQASFSPHFGPSKPPGQRKKERQGKATCFTGENLGGFLWPRYSSQICSCEAQLFKPINTDTHEKDLRGKRNFFSSQTCFPKMQLVATIRSSFWINTFPTGNTVELSTYLRTRPVLISVPTKRSYCCYHLFSILHCANQRNTSESRKILPILEELLHTLNPD